MAIITSTLNFLDEDWQCLIKEKKYLSYKKRGHKAYDYLRKGKVATLIDNISKNNDSQKTD